MTINTVYASSGVHTTQRSQVSTWPARQDTIEILMKAWEANSSGYHLARAQHEAEQADTAIQQLYLQMVEEDARNLDE